MTMLADGKDAAIILVTIFVFVIVLVGMHNIRMILQTREIERTKREVAAYMAEGTIRPEDAPKILGTQSTQSEQKIADAVSWGTIKPEKAESLIRAMREAKA